MIPVIMGTRIERAGRTTHHPSSGLSSPWVHQGHHDELEILLLQISDGSGEISNARQVTAERNAVCAVHLPNVPCMHAAEKS